MLSKQEYEVIVVHFEMEDIRKGGRSGRRGERRSGLAVGFQKERGIILLHVRSVANPSRIARIASFVVKGWNRADIVD